MPQGGGFGQFSFGESPFGGAPISASVVIDSVVSATGPQLTVTYTPSNPQSDVERQHRFQLIQTSTGGVEYDTGWSPSSVASGGTGTFVVNLVDQNLNLNTGTGGFYEVVVWSSPSAATPTSGGWVAKATSSPFDVNWGDPALTWVIEPAAIVAVPLNSTTTLAISWAYSDPGGYAETAYQVVLSSPSGNQVFYDTSLVSGAGTTANVPGVQANTSYLLTVTAYNSNGLESNVLEANFSTGQPISTAISGGFLARYLGIIGYELDTLRSKLEALRFVNDPMRCPGNLLPALAKQLGCNYEDDMGMNQLRMLLSTIVHQYKTKGTLPAIAGISTAVTGYASIAAVNTNLLLSSTKPVYMRSATSAGTGVSFLDTYGSWPASQSPPTNYPTALASATGTIGGVGFTWNGAGSAPTAVTWGTRPAPVGGGLTATMNGAAIAQSTVTGYGIPVRGLNNVSFSFWVWIAGFSSSFNMSTQINFYDITGTALASSSTYATTLTQGAWTQVTAADVPVPAGACWAGVVMTPSSSPTFVAHTSVVYFTGAYFGGSATSAASSVPAVYQSPRAVNISLLSDRVNYLRNPSFEGLEAGTTEPPTAGGTTFNWAAVNCTLAPSQAAVYQVPNVPNPGSWSCSVTASAAGSMSVTSGLTPINNGLLFTGSAYALSPGTVRSFEMVLMLYDAAGNFLSSIPGNQTGEFLSEWVRGYVQVNPGAPLAPNVAQMALRITWLGCAAGEVHYFDSALLEPVWALRPYFDAGLFDSATPPINATDYLWATTASVTVSGGGAATVQAGPSYFYRNYARTLERLVSILAGNASQILGGTTPLSITGFVPLGTPYALVTPTSV
jgi:phage tail-like protein